MMMMVMILFSSITETFKWTDMVLRVWAVILDFKSCVIKRVITFSAAVMYDSIITYGSVFLL